MQINWYDFFISFSYGVGSFKGTIAILNPLYVVLLLFVPSLLYSLKNRLKLPKILGLEIWKVGFLLVLGLFLLGICWQLTGMSK